MYINILERGREDAFLLPDGVGPRGENLPYQGDLNVRLLRNGPRPYFNASRNCRGSGHFEGECDKMMQ